MKCHAIIIVLVLLMSLTIFSCNKQSLQIFKSKSARTQYLNTLEQSGIHLTKMGKEWQEAANEALLSAAELELPIAIRGSFKSKSIEASAWKIQLEEGATITILVHWQSQDSSQLIVDWLAGPEWEELKSDVSNNDSLRIEADETGHYLLRIQPELLGQGNYQVQIYGTATFAVFPVQGKSSLAVQSVWGDAREGGRRSHEGVDIFAARGTPVLAPVEGTVTSVRDKGLGGKQVWVRDRERNWNLYFAHLDSQLVNPLQRVQPGDTLGTVGNTGNARTTAPHLHFGIYRNGAINPFPAIRTDFKTPTPVPDREYALMMKVNVSSANLRNKPSTSSEVVSRIDNNTPITIMGWTADWFQVRTAEGIIGFLYQNLLSPLDTLDLDESIGQAYAKPSPFSGDSLLVELTNFKKIGDFEGFFMITDMDGNIFYLSR